MNCLGHVKYDKFNTNVSTVLLYIFFIIFSLSLFVYVFFLAKS